MPETWIVNTSPLVTLAKIGHLYLLMDMATQVLIPDTVAAEVLSGPPADPARQALLAGWSVPIAVGALPQEVQDLNLDAGEAAVLALALRYEDCTLILDDAKARKAARRLGLPVMGTLGIILRARREDRIPAAADILRRLKTVGLYLPEELLPGILAELGEVWP